MIAPFARAARAVRAVLLPALALPAFVLALGPALPSPLSAQSVTDLVLVDAESNADLQSLSDGDVIQTGDYSTSGFSIRAVTDPSTVGSVRFAFDGTSNYQTENAAPYALAGDSNGDYTAVPELSQDGSYTLTATPYTESDAGGTEGTSLQVSFSVDTGSSSPTTCSSDGTDPPAVTGTLRRWHPVTVVVDGPCSGEDASPNPFLDYRLTVTFTHDATGTTVAVPGYFAADGDAANTGATSGTTWHAHFTPRRTGTYSFETSFREGTDVAISLDATAGTATSYDGQTGSFTIEETDKSGRDHRGKGILQSVDGRRYLEFDDGSLFLKGGADSPENLLAYVDFDGTYNNSGTDYVRDYNHSQDWTSADPTWGSGRGKGLIGALNYLAGEGMKAFSFLTMNVNGDGDDVWPWTSPANTLRYDVSKLAQWEIVFSHADAQGLFKHFKTQETENDQYLDDGALGRERKLYYRELVARFSHHHALNWNLGEEYDVYREKDDGDQSRLKEYADYVSALDPYDHPIVVHTYPSQRDNVYTDLLGDADFDGPSIQLGGMDDGEANEAVRRWVSESASSGNQWVVSIDEPGTAGSGLQPDSDDNYGAAREVLWATFFAGGDGLEWYFGYSYPDNDLNADDWRSRDRFWDQHRYALELMRLLPFATMRADNGRLGGESGYVFSDGADTFAVYLTDGGTAATLDLPDGTFDLQWYDPRNGGSLKTGEKAQVEGGTDTPLGAPPTDTGSDWVAVLTRPSDVIPVEMSGFSASATGPSTVTLQWTTVTETDNAGFDVLHRAPSARDFQDAGFVEGAGTTTAPKSYTYRIGDLGPGTHAFRLRQVDTDGSATLTDSVAVLVAPETAGQLTPPSPSPATTRARATLLVQQAQEVRVQLFDALGREVRTVFQKRVRPSTPAVVRIRTRDLAPGLYFVRADGETFTTVRRLSVVR